MKFIALGTVILLAGCETMPTHERSSIDLCETLLFEKINQQKVIEIGSVIQARGETCENYRQAIFDRAAYRKADKAETQRKLQASQEILNNFLLQQQINRPPPTPIVPRQTCDTRYIGGMYRTQCY